MNKLLFTFIFASFFLSGIQASYAMEENSEEENSEEGVTTKKIKIDIPLHIRNGFINQENPGITTYRKIPSTPRVDRIQKGREQNENLTQEEKRQLRKRSRVVLFPPDPVKSK
jgi:hypothetical protein